jgi:hypothetical protein
MAVVTSKPLTISYFIADIADALATFDRIRWLRSRTGADGLFEEATQPAATAATLIGTLDEPHSVDGKTLNLRVNGSVEYTITFASPDPADNVDVAAEINAVAGATLLADDDGSDHLRLRTLATGTGASIEILDDSDAAPYLGLATDAVGQGVDTTLVAGTHEYFLTDQNSDAEFWYRVELYHSVTGDLAELSVPFLPTVPVIPYAETITGYVQLAGLTGKPDVGRKLAVWNVSIPNRNPSATHGILKQVEEVETNSDGYAEIRLVRGITVDVNIIGTGFTRRIAVPSSGDSFDLLDASLVVSDEFGIQEPDIDYALRTS